MPLLPLPPRRFQELVCGPNDTHLFDEVGRWLVAFLDHEGLIAPGATFLDVGCGCGRVARHLVDRPLAAYWGFDRHSGMIAWARDTITAANPHFQFTYVPLTSLYTTWDAEPGTVDSASFTFPYPDASIDTALLASVFTHMQPTEVRHYLNELARVVRPGGHVLLSIFFDDHEVTTIHGAVNVFHERRVFLADLAETPFTSRGAPQQFISGRPFDPAARPPPATSYTHHWYHLTRA